VIIPYLVCSFDVLLLAKSGSSREMAHHALGNGTRTNTVVWWKLLTRDGNMEYDALIVTHTHFHPLCASLLSYKLAASNSVHPGKCRQHLEPHTHLPRPSRRCNPSTSPTPVLKRRPVACRRNQTLLSGGDAFALVHLGFEIGDGG
jgi:hypothetical protein